MIKIKGLTEQDIIEVAEKVAKNHQHKTFGYLTENDIHQEIWLIILDKLIKFDINKSKSKDPKKALEHFLNSLVAKRLINLYRDKYLVYQRQNQDNPHKTGTSHMPSEFTSDVAQKNTHSLDWNSLDQDLLEFVVSHLSANDIKILEAILNGENISPYYKSKLSKHIKGIMKVYGNG